MTGVEVPSKLLPQFAVFSVIVHNFVVEFFWFLHYLLLTLIYFALIITRYT